MATTAAAPSVPADAIPADAIPVDAVPADAHVRAEVRRLRRWSHLLLGGLAAAAAGSAAGIALLLPHDPAAPGSTRLIGIALLGGMLGSSASALRSACERVACGFELDESPGVWPPDAGKGEKMNARMVPLLLVRPLLGAATGLVAYAGVVGGFLIATPNQPTSFSPQGILFFALLAGLFAKTFLHRMDVVFKTLLGDSQHAARRPDDA